MFIIVGHDRVTLESYYVEAIELTTRAVKV
jgi:hypothetical protein